MGLGYHSVPSTNLPNVNPNNFPGTVHFGPSTTVIESEAAQFPFNTGYIDPNLGMYEAANFNAGF
jgi:hypothetical protein